MNLAPHTVDLITMYGGSAVPVVTSLLTNVHAPNWLKAVTNIVLAAALGLVANSMAADHSVTLGAVAFEHAGVSVVGSIVGYFGLWQHLGISNLLPNFGIGGPKPDPVPTVLPAPAAANLVTPPTAPSVDVAAILADVAAVVNAHLTGQAK